MQDSLKQHLVSCLFEESDHAFIALDAKHVMQAWSKGMGALTQHEPKDMVGKPFSALFSHRRVCGRVLAAAQKTGFVRNFETMIVHQSGGQERVFITMQPIAPTGGLLVEVSPALEDLGAAPNNQTIQETLVRMERFSAVGRMTAAFAHEMRTPIHVISSTAELILGELPADSVHRNSVDMILRNAQHAGMSIRALLDFSKSGKSELRKGSINDLFKTTLRLIGKLFEKEGVEVELEFGDIPSILVDDKSMRAVIHSLLINAVEAMPKGGKLSIRTDVSPKRGGARFSIQDTGIGMSAEVLKRIGSAFFTTKEDGTGLGLYLTKRVLAEHHAEITFASTEGQGSTVSIEFPSGR